MKNKNHNIRFNVEKEAEKRAWECLHSEEVRRSFKSQNRFAIEAINDYYDRHLLKMDDPYLETREKEDAFADRIVGQVESKVLSNLPALIGMYIAQMQSLSLSVPTAATSVNGNLDGVYGGQQSRVISDTIKTQAYTGEKREEEVEQLPDNDLLDFDAF